MVVTDGVFSMDGTIGKIDQICDIAHKYGAIVYVDECHGTGVLGEKGRGAVELKNALNKIDMISSTMGKALGGANGGFITGRKKYIDILKKKSHAYLNSGSLC